MPRRRRAGPKWAAEPFAPEDPSMAPGAGTDERGRRRYDPAWDDWREPRRWPGVLISCVIVLAFIGVVVWHYRPATPVKKSSIAIGKLILHSPPYVPGPGGDVTRFTGTADASSLGYNYAGGLLVLHASCECQYNFVVTISNSEGTPVQFPVNVLGAFATTVDVSGGFPGRYTLSVIATGPWSIQMIQPSPTLQAVPTPFRYFSEGNSVLGPFSSANRFLSLKFLSFTDGYIFVHILGENGAAVGAPFAARGGADKSLTLANLPDPYFLEVQASGFWNLYVQRTASG